MPFLGDLKHSAGNDACDREVGSNGIAEAVDSTSTQTKIASCDDDEDMDDDVAMTFPQRVSLKRERSEVSRQFMPAPIQGLIGRLGHHGDNREVDSSSFRYVLSATSAALMRVDVMSLSGDTELFVSGSSALLSVGSSFTFSFDVRC
jgi:hypothetical protein